MSTGIAIKVLENFRRNLKPGCDMDRALDVAIKELKRKRTEMTRNDRDKERDHNIGRERFEKRKEREAGENV